MTACTAAVRAVRAALPIAMDVPHRHSLRGLLAQHRGEQAPHRIVGEGVEFKQREFFRAAQSRQQLAERLLTAGKQRRRVPG